MKDKRSLIIFVALILSFATLNAAEPKIDECAGMTRDECLKISDERYKELFKKEVAKLYEDFWNYKNYIETNKKRPTDGELQIMNKLFQKAFEKDIELNERLAPQGEAGRALIGLSKKYKSNKQLEKADLALISGCLGKLGFFAHTRDEIIQTNQETYRTVKQAIEQYPQMSDILTDVEGIFLSIEQRVQEDEFDFRNAALTRCFFDNGGLVSNEYKHLKHLYEEQK